MSGLFLLARGMTADGEISLPARSGSDWIRILSLLAITLTCVYLTASILAPFLSALVWAVALAVVTYPIFQAFKAKLRSGSAAAGIMVLALGTLLLIPSVWVSRELIMAGIEGFNAIIPSTALELWKDLAKQYPSIAKFFATIEESFHISIVIDDFISTLGARTTRLIKTSMGGLSQMILTLFVIFFLLRDGPGFLNALRSLIPLSDNHTERVLQRVNDTIHATLFGMVAVAALQGFLGGLLFWWLNIPGAVIWGTIMALLALVPYLGAFIVWVPVAAFLALHGAWSSALITVVWGTVVVGFSDNLIYPILVGKRMHYHSLLVFLFLVGGFLVFGTAGVVLGPIILATTDGLISEWRNLESQSSSQTLGAQMIAREKQAATHINPTRMMSEENHLQ